MERRQARQPSLQARGRARPVRQAVVRRQEAGVGLKLGSVGGRTFPWSGFSERRDDAGFQEEGPCLPNGGVAGPLHCAVAAEPAIRSDSALWITYSILGWSSRWPAPGNTVTE
jgi:hypothetical protein